MPTCLAIQISVLIFGTQGINRLGLRLFLIPITSAFLIECLNNNVSKSKVLPYCHIACKSESAFLW